MKLYWRVKVEGKWTYKAVTATDDYFVDDYMNKLCANTRIPMELEE
tara:strand:+ start:429 stop:566 length:138 start_codon:yes stop_codon:yes gene_type:complete